MALDAYQKFPPPTFENRLSAATLHLMIECLRTSFADAREYVADADHMKVSVDSLLNGQDHIMRRMQRIDLNRSHHYPGDQPLSSSDTVSFQVVDSQGNAMSVVNSVYEGFGSGICPPGLGFCLQNRA